ncbi:hypothetical protein [uncultured Dechloromonas sp.]|uniref:hypothetical protein n=1 Tax=uncultured Dechloromonas sp. TaxID=171719 RepID=UPI0025ED4F4E|nr:hypothetical protein [uncultured Dechloromonas sp.]
MSKEAAGQPAKDEVKAAEVATRVVEKNEPVTAQTAAPAPQKPVATAAAVKKVAAKPKVEKKVVAAKPAKKEVAEKPAPAPVAKMPAKPVKKAPTAAKEKVAEAPKPEKAPKVKKQAPKKPKLVRDSFTIPETDYALFATLKQRALTAGVEVKKSEILRAAVVALAKLDDAELVKAIGLVERIKTGRPKK